MDQDIEYANKIGEWLSPTLITAAITSPFTTPIFTAVTGQRFGANDWATILARPNLEDDEKKYFLNLLRVRGLISKFMVANTGFLYRPGTQPFAFLENPDVPPLISNYPPR